MTWLGSQIGYLQETTFPTWPGNSVLTGHVTAANGQPGPFANLGRLVWGNQILIRAWGQVYTYEVRSVNLWTEPNTPACLARSRICPG